MAYDGPAGRRLGGVEPGIGGWDERESRVPLFLLCGRANALAARRPGGPHPIHPFLSSLSRAARLSVRMSTRARTPNTGRPRAAAAGIGRHSTAAANLASHPLAGPGARSASPASFRGTPTNRSREASPVRRPSPLHAAPAEGGGVTAAVHDEVYPPPPAASAGAHVASLEEYRRLYTRSLADPEGFWGDLAREFHWETPWEAGNFMR